VTDCDDNGSVRDSGLKLPQTLSGNGARSSSPAREKRKLRLARGIKLLARSFYRYGHSFSYQPGSSYSAYLLPGKLPPAACRFSFVTTRAIPPDDD
jgi:hypothetical protein